MTKDAVALVTKEDWDGFCTHTETVEKQYRERDGIIPELTDHTNLNLGCNSDMTAIIRMSTLRVSVTAVNLTLNAFTLCLMATVTWSLHRHSTVKY
jgi:hypothetical protein